MIPLTHPVVRPARRTAAFNDVNPTLRLSRYIQASDVASRPLIVFNTETGEIIHLVQAICVAEGWFDRLVRREDGTFVWDPKTREFVLERVFGPWGLKPKGGSAVPNLGRGVRAHAPRGYASTNTPE